MVFGLLLTSPWMSPTYHLLNLSLLCAWSLSLILDYLASPVSRSLLLQFCLAWYLRVYSIGRSGEDLLCSSPTPALLLWTA